MTALRYCWSSPTQRGGKFGPLEGGIRVAAFVSGGYLPPTARGTTCSGMISVADWYGTLARLAGDANPIDEKAAKAWPPLPPIDSLDVWPLLIGQSTVSPRTVLPVDDVTIIVGDHKLILTSPGARHGVFVRAAAWTGPLYPNATTPLPGRDAGAVRMNCSAGCLFDVVTDPEERHDLAPTTPALVAQLQQQLSELKRRYFQNHDAAPACIAADWEPGWWGRSCACYMAAHVHGDNTSGPWLGPYGR